MSLNISRVKRGRGFSYQRDGKPITNKAELARIAGLAIPPAWTDVQIAVRPGAKVQASGRDAKNRLQYIYNPAFQAKRAATKFDRITNFAHGLPKLRRRIEKDLARKRFDKRKVIACAVSLMDETYIRIGNEQYAKENASYGLTTLRSKHVEVKGNKVILDFDGKSGQHQHKEVEDARLARLIRKLDDMPGHELFRYYDPDGSIKNLQSSDVNDYIKEIMGTDYSAKDFRTWGGTLRAYVELSLLAWPQKETERKKAFSACINKVAKKLGNTPAIARSSYIDPRIFMAYEKSKGFQEVEQAVESIKKSKYLNHDEKCALKLLTA